MQTDETGVADKLNEDVRAVVSGRPTAEIIRKRSTIVAKNVFRIMRSPLTWITVVLAATIVVPTYLANYNPLVPGMVFWHQPTECFHDEDMVSPRSEHFKLIRLENCAPGQSVRWGYTIRNDGPYSITIEKIDLLPMGPALTEIRLGGNAMTVVSSKQIQLDPSTQWNQIPLFRPFRLGPHQEYWVYFGVAYSRTCGGSGVTGTTPVTFKVLGITRHADLPVEHSFQC